MTNSQTPELELSHPKIQIPQNTFLQKLLGRNYKWWFCLIYNIKLSLVYKVSSLFVIIRDLLPMFISLLIYGTFLKTDNYALYFLVGNGFFKIATVVWDVSWDIRNDIKSGYLVSKMMRPSNPILHYLCISLGVNFYPILVNFTILTILVFYFKVQFLFNFNSFISLFLVLISLVIFFFVEIIIGSITFWITETNTLIETKNILVPLLAGSLVFLDTNSTTQIFKFLPFSFAVHHPMQIYLGKYSPLETFFVFLGGVFWCIFLYFLAKFVFQMGLKKNESVGL